MIQIPTSTESEFIRQQFLKTKATNQTNKAAWKPSFLERLWISSDAFSVSPGARINPQEPSETAHLSKDSELLTQELHTAPDQSFI